MASRHVPAAIKRALLEECGYRCAVPTCRGTSALQFEHIEDWAKLEPKAHDFEKMIVLCATCHSRVTSGEISKSAIKAYKRNLAIVSARYSQLEMRLLEAYYDGGLRKADGSETHLKHTGTIPSAFNDVDLLHLQGLQRDGLVSVQDFDVIGMLNPVAGLISEAVGQENAKTVLGSMNLNTYLVMPTFKTLEFIENYFGGREIE